MAAKNAFRGLLLVASLLFHPALSAEAVPSFTAHYTLSRSGITVGETIRTLSPAPNGEHRHKNKNYSINYKDSTNLDYDGTNIHRNYNGWIANLDRAIKTQLATL